MWEAHACFHMHRALRFSKAIDIHGQEIAERNAGILRRYNEFFVPAGKSLYVNSLIGLNIFFESSKDSLGYKDLLRDVKQNMPDHVYRELESEIKNTLSKNSDLIERVKNFRHQYLAHESKLKKEITFTVDEIESLFKTTQDIFNQLCQVYDNSHTEFPLDAAEASSTIDALFRDLDLGFAEFRNRIHKMNTEPNTD